MISNLKCLQLKTIVLFHTEFFFACHGRNQQHTPITIKKGAYIGMRANVISGKNGVTIGENAVIGACTLVNKDVPNNATAVGVPCRILEKQQ